MDMDGQEKVNILECDMVEMGTRARAAQRDMLLSTAAQRREAIASMVMYIRQEQETILRANAQDMDFLSSLEGSDAMKDRLKLTHQRIEAICSSLENISSLEDKVSSEIDRWQRPNGLKISRVRVPLGVIGVIYESRPNVTSDAGALCIKAGNAVILRGGKESFHSNKALHACLVKGLRTGGLPEDAIQLVSRQDRGAVGQLLRMSQYIDVIVPRGGRSLVARVEAESRVPVFAHLEGIVHMYIHQDADLEMAKSLVLNSKMRRPGICGALETILVDHGVVHSHLPGIVATLLEGGCQVRGDETVQRVDARVQPAKEQDWSTEYLEPIVAIKIVPDVDGAIHHIATYSSHHTESIVTQNIKIANMFRRVVDSAIVMHNVSTQFADGGEFGMGAEIGISTGRLHARGPVGVDQLMTFKYVVEGYGQTRD